MVPLIVLKPRTLQAMVGLKKNICFLLSDYSYSTGANSKHFSKPQSFKNIFGVSKTLPKVKDQLKASLVVTCLNSTAILNLTHILINIQKEMLLAESLQINFYSSISL